MKKILLKVFVLLLFISFLNISLNSAENKYMRIDMGSGGLFCNPKVSYSKMEINLSAPNGIVYSKTFTGGGNTFISISDICQGNVPEGTYTFEVKLYPQARKDKRKGIKNNKNLTKENLLEIKNGKPMLTHGHFSIRNSSVKGGTNSNKGSGNDQDGGDQTGDIVHADDVIIDGSACIGNDCYSGYAFGFDTLVFMENNLRIFFDDTSTIQNYPRNDWRIICNDSTDGGGSYFSIEDATEVSRIFTLEAGAPDNSIYVDSYGDVGINTSTPYYELHIVDGDSPCVRLDQDASYGWTAQKWDLCGNESNFFIRDATHASKLPFRIEPEAPTDSIFTKSNGNVGMGTGSPGYALEVERTGANVILVADRTDGATCKLGSTANQGQFGTISNHSLKFVTSNTTRMSLDNNTNRVDFTSGAVVTTAGVFQNASSRDLKENIEKISNDEAINTLNGLAPVKYTYKADKSKEKYVGFIAEDVPELVATKDRKNMSPMDVVAVLTKVVQQQQKAIKLLKEKIDKLEKKK